jgi:hypothetical protein
LQGFNSLEQGVGMQKWGLTALNWVWAYRAGLELGVGMQKWISTALNWVWARPWSCPVKFLCKLII